MELVDRYIAELEGTQEDWTNKLVEFMRKDYPEIRESFEFQMPTFTGPDFYIAFDAKRGYFYFYTDDISMNSFIQRVLPGEQVSGDCIKIKYDKKTAIENIMEACEEIIAYHRPDIAK